MRWLAAAAFFANVVPQFTQSLATVTARVSERAPWPGSELKRWCASSAAAEWNACLHWAPVSVYMRHTCTAASPSTPSAAWCSSGSESSAVGAQQHLRYAWRTTRTSTLKNASFASSSWDNARMSL